jgi:integrase/recombinase XerC
VPLNRAALAAARLPLRSRGNPIRGPLFVTQAGERYNVRQLASEFKKTARCCEDQIAVNPHNLRHTFATWLARSASNVSLVQKILGHENVNTTLRHYVHTGDYELAGATANLKGKRDTRRSPTVRADQPFNVIPFPQQRVV